MGTVAGPSDVQGADGRAGRLEAERRFAIDAVVTASRLTRAVRSAFDPSQATSKSDASPVTVADLGAQALVSLALADTLPNDGLMGEEDSGPLAASPELAEAVLARVREHRPAVSPEDLRDALDRCSDPGGAGPPLVDARPGRWHEGLPAQRAVRGGPGAHRGWRGGPGRDGLSEPALLRRARRSCGRWTDRRAVRGRAGSWDADDAAGGGLGRPCRRTRPCRGPDIHGGGALCRVGGGGALRPVGGGPHRGGPGHHARAVAPRFTDEVRHRRARRRLDLPAGAARRLPRERLGPRGRVSHRHRGRRARLGRGRTAVRLDHGSPDDTQPRRGRDGGRRSTTRSWRPCGPSSRGSGVG